MELDPAEKRSLSKASREQLELGILIAGLGFGSVDYLADTITLDARAAELFDLEPDTPIRRAKLHEKIHVEDQARIKAITEALLSRETENFFDVTHRVQHEDGTVLWVHARKLVTFGIIDKKEVPISGVVAVQNITKLKSSEEKVKLLLGEINHRAKNLLTVVQSIARMTARKGDLSTFVTRFSDRLTSLSANQDLIVENLWTDVVLEKLVQAHLQPFIENSGGRILIKGPSMKIHANAAQAIGMALHELATNAVKYGALSNVKGKVEVSWRRRGQTLEMKWAESGGPKVKPPKETGFGEKVINQMAAQSLQGTVKLTYEPSGVMWVLKVPTKEILP